MTVKELIENLEGAPQEAEVYMVTDVSEANIDEEEGRYIKVHKVNNVGSETNFDGGWDSEDETNVLLITEEI